MFFNKKGFEQLTAVILGVIGLVVLVGILVDTSPEAKESVLDKVCDVTVDIADKFEGIGFRPLCYTKDLEFDEKDKEDVKKRIAEKMVDAFIVWGRGEKDPEGKAWLISDTHCFKYARFKLTRFEGEISSNEMINFLKDNKMSGGVRYWDYFKKNNDNIRVVVSLKDGLKKDNYYGIVYMEGVTSNFWDKMIRYSLVGSYAGLKMSGLGGPWIGGTVALISVGVGAVIGGFDELMKLLYYEEEEKPVDGILITDYSATKFCGGYIK